METENNVVEQVVEQPQTEEVQQEPKQERTFTQDDINRIVQKEKAKMERKFEERLNALEENQKLQNMSEAQKAEFQAQKEREQFENERKAFYEERDAFNKAKYKQTIEQQLIEKGLPTSLSDMLVAMSAEEVNLKIIELSESFGASVNNQIQEKLKQTSIPQEPTVQHKTYLTREQIANMTPQEYKANRDLINESLKQLNK